MIDITEYLENIYNDFAKYADGSNFLCDLKSLTFEAGDVPDYRNKNIQQLYLLRYAFAYAFEYKFMYDEVISKMGNPAKIGVTSIGCGVMLDYWSLVNALKSKKNKDCEIKYVGIDKIEWKYKMKPRRRDKFYFLERNAIDYFNNNEKFVSDIYFFPKSISEFSLNDVSIMARNLSTKPIEKERLFLCISLRSDQGSMERDMEKSRMLVSAFKKNGYKEDISYDDFGESVGIAAYDCRYVYPQKALDYIKSLNEKCRQFIYKEKNCERDCKIYLNRCPVLKTGNIRYQIITLEREK